MSEFLQFQKVTVIFGYFCDTHLARLRGTNEITIGLIRQQPPMGTKLDPHSPDASPRTPRRSTNDLDHHAMRNQLKGFSVRSRNRFTLDRELRDRLEATAQVHPWLV